MNVNKKQLKAEVAANLNVLNVKVKRSFVYVAISYEHEGTLYHAFDFSKWATEDMTLVERLTKLYRQMIEANCGCRRCNLWRKQLAAMIERYDWSEEKGIAIATGRAVADIVGQIMATPYISPEPTEAELDSIFGKVGEEPKKSNAGLSEQTAEWLKKSLANVASSEAG